MKNPNRPIKILCFLLYFAAMANPIKAQEYGRDFTSSIRLNEINPQAFRHFKKNFPMVTHEFWYKAESGIVVKYTSNNVPGQVFYDHRGDLIFSMKYMEAKDLDKDIKYRVNKEFPGYAIDVAGEVTSDDSIVYFLSLKNKMSVKNVLISETELKILEDQVYAAH